MLLSFLFAYIVYSLAISIAGLLLGRNGSPTRFSAVRCGSATMSTTKRTAAGGSLPADSGSDEAHPKVSNVVRQRLSDAKKKRGQEFHRVRHYLLTQVARGTPVIQKLQVWAIRFLFFRSVFTGGRLIDFEIPCLDFVQSFRSAPLDWFFIIWSFLGDKVPYVLLLPWYVVGLKTFHSSQGTLII
jgi:hypothetical protein